MAQGALRWEKDGKIYMDWHEPDWEKGGKIYMDWHEPETKRVKEPAHWLVLWPFNAKSTKLPTYPGKFGSYIMYEGTPWSHLMIYQDPLLIGK
jgi:hypothetical protein